MSNSVKFMLAALLVCAANALAQWNMTNPNEIAPGRPRGGKGLAVDPPGNAYVLPVVSGDLYMRWRSVGSGQWSANEWVSDSNATAPVNDAAIAWNVQLDQPVVAYEANNRIWFAARNDSTGWVRTALSAADETAWTPDIACNADGILYVVWVDEDDDEYQLNYAYFDGGSWETNDIAAELGAFGTGATPRVAVGPDGEGHITFRGVVVGAYAAQHATNEALGEDNWIITTLQVPHAESYPGDVAVDANGGVHCVSQGSEGFGIPRQVYYHTRDTAGEWAFGTSVSGETNAGDGRVAVNSLSMPHCVWLEISGNFYTGMLGYATAETGWTVGTVYGNSDGDVALAIDGGNFGHLLINDMSGNAIYERSTLPLAPPEHWPEVTLSPDTIDFDTVVVGEGGTIIGWVHNFGEVGLELERGFVAGDGFSGGGVLHGTLSPNGGGMGTSIHFAPDAPGEYSGWWVVETNAPTSPDSVVMRGVAVPDTVFTPELLIDPTDMRFDSVRVGADSVMAVRLENVGDSVLTLFDFEVFGEVFNGPPGWIVVNLAPGAFMTTGVRFAPTDERMYEGYAVVFSNAASSPDTISLEGFGIWPDAAGDAPLPDEFSFAPLYPNPFNGAVNVSYTLARASLVSLRVYDVLGREVSVLVDAAQSAGEHTLQWNCDECAAGIYLLRLEAAGNVLVQKAAFVK